MYVCGYVCMCVYLHGCTQTPSEREGGAVDVVDGVAMQTHIVEVPKGVWVCPRMPRACFVRMLRNIGYSSELVGDSGTTLCVCVCADVDSPTLTTCSANNVLYISIILLMRERA